MKSFTTLVSTLTLLVLLAAPAFAQDVLIVHAVSDGQLATDAQDKINAWIAPDRADMFDATGATPSAADLESYSAVLVFTDTAFFDTEALGDALADFCDGGGTVVQAMYALEALGGPAGRWISGGYAPMVYGNTFSQGPISLGTVWAASHPVMAQVATLDSGALGVHSRGGLAIGAISIADWNNGYNLVSEMPGKAGRIIGINMFPASSDVDTYGDGWLASTNGDRLMANAVSYRAPRPLVISPFIAGEPFHQLLGYAGMPYSQTFTVTGGVGPYSWSISSGLLPTNLSLNPVTGELSGVVVDTWDTANFTVAVTDANLAAATASYLFDTRALPVVSPFTPGEPFQELQGYAGQTYSQTFTVTGGVGPYSWSISGGLLPTNLSLNPVTGELSGVVVDTWDTANFTVTVTDANLVAASASYLFDTRALPVVSPFTPGEPFHNLQGYAGQSYSQTFTVTGGVGPYSWSISGGLLPTNLSLNSVTGELSGVVVDTWDTANFTVTVTDANLVAASASYLFEVRTPQAPVMTPGFGLPGTVTGAGPSDVTVSCGVTVQSGGRALQVLFAFLLPLMLLVIRRRTA